MNQTRPRSVGRPRKILQPQDDEESDDIMDEEARAKDVDPYLKIKPGA